MKKEIMNLVESEEGTFRLNNIAYLRRWTKDGMGCKVDRLELEFDSINHVNFGIYDTEIKSRDYEGIIDECQILIERFINEVSETLIKNLKAGYRNKVH